MKHHILDFIRRGLAACGIGPIVLAVVYLILQRNGQAQMLTVNQVCLGIFSLTALAFIAGGMNCIYQIERLPLMVAILIHGCVLFDHLSAQWLAGMGCNTDFGLFCRFCAWIFGDLGGHIFRNQKENRYDQRNVKEKPEMRGGFALIGSLPRKYKNQSMDALVFMVSDSF